MALSTTSKVADTIVSALFLGTTFLGFNNAHHISAVANQAVQQKGDDERNSNQISDDNQSSMKHDKSNHSSKKDKDKDKSKDKDDDNSLSDLLNKTVDNVAKAKDEGDKQDDIKAAINDLNNQNLADDLNKIASKVADKQNDKNNVTTDLGKLNNQTIDDKTLPSQTPSQAPSQEPSHSQGGQEGQSSQTPSQEPSQSQSSQTPGQGGGQSSQAPSQTAGQGGGQSSQTPGQGQGQSSQTPGQGQDSQESQAPGQGQDSQTPGQGQDSQNSQAPGQGQDSQSSQTPGQGQDSQESQTPGQGQGQDSQTPGQEQGGQTPGQGQGQDSQTPGQGGQDVNIPDDSDNYTGVTSVNDGTYTLKIQYYTVDEQGNYYSHEIDKQNVTLNQGRYGNVDSITKIGNSEVETQTDSTKLVGADTFFPQMVTYVDYDQGYVIYQAGVILNGNNSDPGHKITFDNPNPNFSTDDSSHGAIDLISSTTASPSDTDLNSPSSSSNTVSLSSANGSDPGAAINTSNVLSLN